MTNLNLILNVESSLRSIWKDYNIRKNANLEEFEDHIFKFYRKDFSFQEMMLIKKFFKDAKKRESHNMVDLIIEIFDSYKK